MSRSGLIIGIFATKLSSVETAKNVQSKKQSLRLGAEATFLKDLTAAILKELVKVRLREFWGIYSRLLSFFILLLLFPHFKHTVPKTFAESRHFVAHIVARHFAPQQHHQKDASGDRDKKRPFEAA